MSETDLPDPEERRIHTLSPEERRREAIEQKMGLRGQVARRVGPGTRVGVAGRCRTNVRTPLCTPLLMSVS